MDIQLLLLAEPFEFRESLIGQAMAMYVPVWAYVPQHSALLARGQTLPERWCYVSDEGDRFPPVAAASLGLFRQFADGTQECQRRE